MYKHASLLPLLLLSTTTASPVGECTQLKWGQCSDIDVNSTLPYDCSTLNVPLDYLTPSNGSIDLQLVRVLAPQQPSQGSVLFNFGGPGAEGRLTLVQLAPTLLLSTGGVYDLVAFDPRGTGNTIVFNCSDTDEELVRLGESVLPGNASDVAVGQAWAQSQRVVGRCSAVERDTGEYLGTAAVARDLMSVVDALDEDGLLRFWGISYGTTLGATVAAMFPERMDKIVLDGVQNVHEYYNGVGLVQQWTDSDKVFSGIWSTCVDAGPELCPLAASYNDSQTLEDAVWNLMWSVKYNPIVIGSDDPVVVDYTRLKYLFAQSLYSTLYWPTTATIVDMLMKGETGDEVLELLASTIPTDFESTLRESRLAASNLGIQCSDKSPDVQVGNLEGIMPTLDILYSTSRFMGDITTSSVMMCNLWKLHARERYTGTWEGIQTANPLLIVGNTYDGHTPLVSARNASASFVDSVVLEINGYGHASVNLQSNCTTAAVAAYFVNGTMPEVGTVCPVDVLPYHGLN